MPLFWHRFFWLSLLTGLLLSTALLVTDCRLQYQHSGLMEIPAQDCPVALTVACPPQPKGGLPNEGKGQKEAEQKETSQQTTY